MAACTVWADVQIAALIIVDEDDEGTCLGRGCERLRTTNQFVLEAPQARLTVCAPADGRTSTSRCRAAGSSWNVSHLSVKEATPPLMQILNLNNDNNNNYELIRVNLVLRGRKLSLETKQAASRFHFTWEFMGPTHCCLCWTLEELQG